MVTEKIVISFEECKLNTQGLTNYQYYINTNAEIISNDNGKNKIVYIKCITHDKNKYNVISFKQLYCIYAILYKFYKNGFVFNGLNVLLSNDSVRVGSSFSSTIGSSDIIWLFEANDRCIKRCKEINETINNARELATELVTNGTIKTINDVLTSKYAKIYNLGIKKFNNIFLSHNKLNTDLIQVNNWDLRLCIHDYKYLMYFYLPVSKYLVDYIINEAKKINVEYTWLFNTLLYETSVGNFLNDKSSRIRNDEGHFIHLFNLFNCWAIIKDTYPCSKTTKVIDKYKKYDINTKLHKDELIEYLTAYILLSYESKSIKNYNNETLIKDIYDLIYSGLYIPTENFVYGDFQINMRNVKLYQNRNIRKDYII